MFDMYAAAIKRFASGKSVFLFLCFFSCSESLREIESHSHITRFLKNAADTVFFLSISCAHRTRKTEFIFDFEIAVNTTSQKR